MACKSRFISKMTQLQSSLSQFSVLDARLAATVENTQVIKVAFAKCIMTKFWLSIDWLSTSAWFRYAREARRKCFTHASVLLPIRRVFDAVFSPGRARSLVVSGAESLATKLGMTSAVSNGSLKYFACAGSRTWSSALMDFLFGCLLEQKRDWYTSIPSAASRPFIYQLLPSVHTKMLWAQPLTCFLRRSLSERIVNTDEESRRCVWPSL